MAKFIEDCLRIIFTELENDKSSLFSCILVNRFWCRIAVPILWKNPFLKKETYLEWKLAPSHYKLFNTTIHLLPASSKQLLTDNNIILPSLHIFQNQPLFNYISFTSIIPSFFIEKMVYVLIKEAVKSDESDEFYVWYEKLEQEVYKLFINNCKNIKKFHWNTGQPLSQYLGASTCFSQLSALTIDLQHVTTSQLSEMAQICQDVEDLKVWYCNGDIPGLISFIDAQRNLQSLFLYFKGVEKQCIQLCEVIERKASTLKKFTTRPIITSLSPKFLPSLINLEYLELNNDNGYEMNNEGVEMQEWNKYLSIAFFPNLQYLETGFLPICDDYKLVENSLGNILEIKIYRYYEDLDFLYNEKLIKAIAKNCPNIEILRIDAEPKNLNEIKEIFLNCQKLKSLYLSTMNEERLVGDRLLEILINFSQITLNEFSFNESWNFSINGLQTFFENWKGRIPLKFTNYLDEMFLFTEEHIMIIKKYRDEGVII